MAKTGLTGTIKSLAGKKKKGNFVEDVTGVNASKFTPPAPSTPVNFDVNKVATQAAATLRQTNPEMFKRTSSDSTLVPQQLPVQSIPTQPVQTQPTPTSPSVFRDSKGRLSGVTLPDGRTFLGLSPRMVNKIVEDFQKERQLPEGAINQADFSKQQQLIQEGKAAMSKVGQFQELPLSEQEKGQLSMKEVATGSLGDVIQQGGIGAGIGAAAGALAGPAAPVAVPALAAAGFATGVIRAVISNAKEEAKEPLRVSKVQLRASKTSLKAIIDGVNKGLISPSDAVELFNNQLAQIDKSERVIKAGSRDSLQRYLTDEDGLDALTRIETFNAGERQYLTAKLQEALLTPNPAQTLLLEEEPLSAEDLI